MDYQGGGVEAFFGGISVSFILWGCCVVIVMKYVCICEPLRLSQRLIQLSESSQGKCVGGIRHVPCRVVSYILVVWWGI